MAVAGSFWGAAVVVPTSWTARAVAGRWAGAVSRGVLIVRRVRLLDAACWRERVVAAGLLGLTATLATAPISAYACGTVAPIGVLANLIAIPLAGVAVPGLVIALGVSWLFPALARLLAAGAGAGLALLDLIARVAAAMPGGHVVMTAGWPAAAASFRSAGSLDECRRLTVFFLGRRAGRCRAAAYPGRAVGGDRRRPAYAGGRRRPADRGAVSAARPCGWGVGRDRDPRGRGRPGRAAGAQQRVQAARRARAGRAARPAALSRISCDGGLRRALPARSALAIASRSTA
jgi:hypothetical protein